jgi:hypothetical protein
MFTLLYIISCFYYNTRGQRRSIDVAPKKGTEFTDDDGLKKEMLDETPDSYQVPLPAYDPVGVDFKPAKSFWTTGRNCPKCAGQLAFREYFKESDLVILFCKQCNATWQEADLRPHEDHAPVGDNFNFRNIPPDMIQRWMDAREEEMKRKGIWT